MIVNTTYTDKEASRLIDTHLGEQFTILQRIKLKGIGSKRMIISNVSPKMKSYLNTVDDLNYGSIELRPKGILIHIHKKLNSFSWIVPYYRLHIYTSAYFSIHANGNFIQFNKNKLFKENKAFIEKMIAQKNTVLNTTDYYGV
ncbi:hypothetical protein IMCC3317_10610 [Kordia antarctica]|uniref:Uncharacterized protein n=1 Tax=Kordia antarctica TaxID=1218801 RepID=A0A7L4ZIF7_9FLAO|nr:hypothetical protein [Kordia antarctica]QHI35714.1 hypothetical protein IMCC3317_10610 [Kordia antarctica]